MTQTTKGIHEIENFKNELYLCKYTKRQIIRYIERRGDEVNIKSKRETNRVVAVCVRRVAKEMEWPSNLNCT